MLKKDLYGECFRVRKVEEIHLRVQMKYRPLGKRDLLLKRLQLCRGGLGPVLFPKNQKQKQKTNNSENKKTTKQGAILKHCVLNVSSKTRARMNFLFG